MTAPARDTGSDEGFWVFAYGSLMWNPGFAYLERRMARLDRFHRAFALSSVHYRGTPERPGLVLGLDWCPGGACTGVAYRICPSIADQVRAYLHERELVSYAYFEVIYPVALLPEADRAETRVDAVCYILDRSHQQYRGGLGLEAQARIIASAEGPRGSNAAYLHATVEHLRDCGIADPDLEALDRMVRARSA